MINLSSNFILYQEHTTEKLLFLTKHLELSSVKRKHFFTTMSHIIANDDIFAYILNFLPSITNITYISDTVMYDIHNIYKLSLVSKKLYILSHVENNGCISNI